MAGHNKWSKVKRLKGALDANCGRLFSRLSKEIAVAARLGGGNPAFNPRLRAVVHATHSEHAEQHQNETPEDILVRLN